MKYSLKSIEKEDDIIKLICRNRNVNFENLLNVLEPDESCVQNPLVYTNMDLTCKTIINTVNNNGIILFIVDSDVDGFCSSAMLILYLREVIKYDKVYYLIHSEKKHGLTREMMDYITKNNIKPNLVMLPDSSSSDYKQHMELKEMGIDIVVIDHHEADERSRDAIVVNNQLDNFGNRTLSGGGMVMKVLEHLDKLCGYNSAWNYMDLCATALVGDCMTMTNAETRFYVRKGLCNITNPLLFELYKVDKDIDFDTISFEIAPIINAFIRVGTMEQKVDLFNALVGLNYMREITIRGQGTFNLNLPEYVAKLSSRVKSEQEKQIKKALESHSEIYEDDLPITLCLIDEEVNKNLSGLIANRLATKTNKPTLVLKEYRGKYSGSGRSIDTFEEFRSYINSLGCFDYALGHQPAFGVGIEKDKLESLKKDLLGKSIEENNGEYRVDKAYYNKVSAYDILTVNDFNQHWCKGFEKPLFFISLDNIDNSNIQIIGAKRDTLKIKHDYITYIKFKCTKEEIEKVKNTKINKIELVGHFNVNEWNDNIYPQVEIVDYEFYGEPFEKIDDMSNCFGFDFDSVDKLKW